MENRDNQDSKREQEDITMPFNKQKGQTKKREGQQNKCKIKKFIDYCEWLISRLVELIGKKLTETVKIPAQK